jgi:hypothetical protein
VVDKHIIHHDAPISLHITISVNQVHMICMVNMRVRHGNMLIMAIYKISKNWESYGGNLIIKHIMSIIASKTCEIASNGRNCRTLITKHAQRSIIVVDKHRERAIVHQVCHNASIYSTIAIQASERTIVQHIGCNHGRKNEAYIVWHVYGNIITSKGFHMVIIGGNQIITWECE